MGTSEADVSETLAHAAERIESLLGEMHTGAEWRAAMLLPEPSEELGQALEAMGHIVRAGMSAEDGSRFDVLLTATAEEPEGEGRLHGLARRVLLSMLEQRRTRSGPADRRS